MTKLGEGITLGNTEDNFRSVDNTQNRNSQTVLLTEIFLLHRNGVCWWPHKQQEDHIFYKLDYRYCRYYDL